MKFVKKPAFVRMPGSGRPKAPTSMRGWVWLAPAVVVLLAITAWPIGRAVWLSLSSYSLTNPEARTSVGFDNYVEILTNRTWWLAIATSLIIVVLVVAVQLALGFAFALVLRRLTVLWPVTRMLVLLPFAIAAIVTAVVWRDAATTGFLASWFRLDSVGQLDQLAAVSLGEIWRGTGIVAVILLAGLTQVSGRLHAAAVADGATGWQRLQRVILPVMGPAFAVAIAYRALDAFRAIEGPLLVDEPGADIHTAPQVIWDTTFSSFELGLGAAMSIVLLAIAAVLGVLLVQLFRVRRVV
ncbi:carbohydrate ABC transporter permease [Aeromicrobium sp.]|uniref:carbohydrate ABC transporter permease n=1 Tax=Aeromicrobium sp. TaxID=1871063 RepID=UPI002FCBDFB7